MNPGTWPVLLDYNVGLYVDDLRAWWLSGIGNGTKRGRRVGMDGVKCGW